MFKPNDVAAGRFAWRLGAVLLAVGAVGAWGAAARASAQALNAPYAVTVKARIGEGRARPAPVRDAFRIRCWQHGRLLFEESIAEVPQAFAGQAMALPSGESVSGTVYLLNSPNGMCLVKPSDAPSRSNTLLPQS